MNIYFVSRFLINTYFTHVYTKTSGAASKAVGISKCIIFFMCFLSFSTDLIVAFKDGFKDKIDMRLSLVPNKRSNTVRTCFL